MQWKETKTQWREKIEERCNLILDAGVSENQEEGKSFGRVIIHHQVNK